MANLTSMTSQPGFGAADRVVQMAYDWRNRPIVVKSGVETTESTSLNRPLTYTVYDNLNQAISTDIYDGDAVSLTSTAGVPNRPSATLLRSHSTQSFDNLGRAYAMSDYGVDAKTGTVSTAPLTSQTWYDSQGNAIKFSQPSGLTVKVAYDSLDRPTAAYATDGGGDSGYADASTLIGDKVWRQAEVQYDANSNVILTTLRDRFDGQTGTGLLGTSTTGVRARVSYAATYYDIANRPVASVDVGTNGGSPWTRPTGIPAASDSTHVSTVAYDNAGRAWSWTAPDGTITQALYDAAGRQTSVIEAAGTSVAFVTTMAYNEDDQLTSITAPGSRTSTFAYDAWGRQNGMTERAGTALARTTTSLLNNVGETISMTDPMGMVSTMQYDVLGRTTGSTVAYGTSLQRSSTASYDALGRVVSASNARGYTTTASYDDYCPQREHHRCLQSDHDQPIRRVRELDEYEGRPGPDDQRQLRLGQSHGLGH